MGLERNKIYNMDCVEGMEKLDDNSVDLVCCSPPYNIKKQTEKINKKLYDHYDDNMEHMAYIGWLKTVFEVAYRKLKVGGRVCINIGDGSNGKIPTHTDITHFMVRELGYRMMTTLIWDKDQISNRTSWGSWKSASSPAFPTMFEYILVFAKETLKIQEKGISDVTRDEFIEFSLATWKFTPETRQKKIGVLQAMFPRELPYRCIKMFSFKEYLDGTKPLIVDPFSGLGTTAWVAQAQGRDFIGFELSPLYCELTEKRLQSKTDDVKEWLDREIIDKYQTVEIDVK